MEALPPIPAERRPNWFSRNWEWVVPGSCLFLVVIDPAFAAAVFSFAVDMMKQSDAYKIALSRAQENPAVIEAIGKPVTQSAMVSGNTNV